MQLSPEREAELMELNMPKIYRAADNFTMRCKDPSVQFSYDDMVQQGAMAFLLYIRRCDNEEQLKTFPWYDAIHAMCVQVLNSQPFSVPKRTSKFSQLINSIPKTISYEVAVSKGLEVDGMSKHWVPDKETQMDFDDFMSSQDESTRRIASMKVYGMSNRKIGAQFGVSDVAISKRLDRLHKKLNEFFEENEKDD